ncbi:MAG: pyridoxal-dependent decarboxylase [Acidobacteriota bacterium]|nr:pyridoxal-dependent decarboxylase [Acidobacteriota bacterium]
MSNDLPNDEFRAALHRAADLAADYLDGVAEYPVLPRVQPGEVTASLPAAPPAEGEPMERILDDYQRLIEPAMTHWNHPGFMAYFSITGSGPGIVGETLAATLNVNAMLWRTSPAAVELERLVCDWLRQMLDLPEIFQGHINDTASSSTLLALAAARHRQALQLKDRPRHDVRQHGLFGAPPMSVYTSDQAHSSVDKAAITLGLGLDGVRRVASDEDFRLDPAALAAAVAEDRAAGRLPIAVVATVGTTSTTSIDPLEPILEICRREDLWLHVDGAYGGSAGICPEYRELMRGMEGADSIVINPHKWLFVPVDCSVLWLRDEEELKEAFSLVPEYLKTGDTGVTNLMDFGPQLGRRFRALKMWMVFRSFGVEGLRRRIREHCRWARELAERIDADPHFEVSAPVPFSLVCFRALDGADGPDEDGEAQDRFNRRLMEAINADGTIFLSHTVLRDRYVLRLAIGNLRTTEEFVQDAWRLIQETAERLRREGS